jgi:hypothetical protein
MPILRAPVACPKQVSMLNIPVKTTIQVTIRSARMLICWGNQEFGKRELLHYARRAARKNVRQAPGLESNFTRWSSARQPDA